MSETVIDFQKGNGLVPVITQDAESGVVLMLAWMNEEAFIETCQSGRAVYYSRSRKKLWRKGEESGNIQVIQGIYIDCDADTILLKVKQLGHVACHEGYQSCFFREYRETELHTIAERLVDPAELYQQK